MIFTLKTTALLPIIYLQTIIIVIFSDENVDINMIYLFSWSQLFKFDLNIYEFSWINKMDKWANESTKLLNIHLYWQTTIVNYKYFIFILIIIAAWLLLKALLLKIESIKSWANRLSKVVLIRY